MIELYYGCISYQSIRSYRDHKADIVNNTFNNTSMMILIKHRAILAQM